MDIRKSGVVSGSDSGAYTDLNRLNNLKVGDRESEGNMRKVAQEFESLFLNEMLKSMRSANEVLGKDNPLNTPADKPLFDRPVTLLAPADSADVVEAARKGETARLTLLGKGGHRPAANVVARIERGKRPWLVVSTPRSGWTDCVGERGPGIAIWLALAGWAAVARR